MTKLDDLLQSLAATVPASQRWLDHQWQTSARGWAGLASVRPFASPLLGAPCRPSLARTSFEVSIHIHHDRESEIRVVLLHAAYTQRCLHSIAATHRLRVTVDSTNVTPGSQPRAAATP